MAIDLTPFVDGDFRLSIEVPDYYGHAKVTLEFPGAAQPAVFTASRQVLGYMRERLGHIYGRATDRAMVNINMPFFVIHFERREEMVIIRLRDVSMTIEPTSFGVAVPLDSIPVLRAYLSNIRYQMFGG